MFTRPLGRALFVACVAVILLPSLVNVAVAGPDVGEDAAELGDIRWFANAPEVDSIKLLQGQVVLIELSPIGSNGYSTGSLLPVIADLYKKYAARGLHVFSIGSGGAEQTEVFMRATLTLIDCRYSVGIGSAGGYLAQTTPHVWLVGVDGKVAYESGCKQGTGRGAAQYSYEGLAEAVQTAMAAVKYPSPGAGVGSIDFVRGVNRVVKSIAKQQYGKARKDAKKLIDGGRADDDELAQAKELLERVQAISDYLFARAQAAETAGDYLGAIAIYKRIEKQFKGEPEADKAEARQDEMKDDDNLKKEIAAQSALQQISSGISASTNYAVLAGTLKSFATRYDGTAAAARATKLAAEAESLSR